MTSSTKRILHDRPMNACHICNGSISFIVSVSSTVLRTVRTLLVRHDPRVGERCVSLRDCRRRARARVSGECVVFCRFLALQNYRVLTKSQRAQHTMSVFSTQPIYHPREARARGQQPGKGKAGSGCRPSSVHGASGEPKNRSSGGAHERRGC